MRLQALRAFACCALLAAGTALGQDFPSKPLRIIVHVPPGSGTDLISRTVGTSMSNSLGQPVVVENRAGASGLVAYEYVVGPSGVIITRAGTEENVVISARIAVAGLVRGW